MTSMPASRSARAMILAPRSWPSRPGLAMRTRIFRCGMAGREYSKCAWRSSVTRGEEVLLGDGDLFVGPEDGAQGIADLAEGGIGFDRVVEVRHQVFRAFGGPHENIEPAAH